ncbi:MAG: hypothetical protein AB7L66_10485 [Gemmatimonadales bacterium]
MGSSRNAGPLPKFPPKTRIPIFKTTAKAAGSAEIPSALSFYYAGIQAVWLWYRAPLSVLRAYLEPLGMTPYDFGGSRGAVNINFFNAACMYGSGQPGNQGIGGFNETEVNIVGFASKVVETVPQGLTLEQYLTAGDVTKRLGNYRVWVACDDAVAVAAGRQIFMENKFLTPYTYDVPMVNNPKSGAKQAVWDWTCQDPQKKALAIYSATVDFAGLAPVPGNMSEVIDLSFDAETRRPVASRRNFFGMFDTYLEPGVAKAARIRLGTSKHPMRHDMQRLVGRSRPVALQVFTSPPCIAEVAGYYADL